jgi:hypothetical protein
VRIEGVEKVVALVLSVEKLFGNGHILIKTTIIEEADECDWEAEGKFKESNSKHYEEWVYLVENNNFQY